MTRALRGRLGPDPTPYTHEGSRSWTRTPKHGGALQSPVAECRARAHATPSARVRERAQAECGAGSGLGGGGQGGRGGRRPRGVVCETCRACCDGSAGTARYRQPRGAESYRWHRARAGDVMESSTESSWAVSKSAEVMDRVVHDRATRRASRVCC